MFKKCLVGRKNVDISLLWAPMPSTLRTTGLMNVNIYQMARKIRICIRVDNKAL